MHARQNAIRGERYAVVPDEVKKYSLGHYGKLPPCAVMILEVLDLLGDGRLVMRSIPPIGPLIDFMGGTVAAC